MYPSPIVHSDNQNISFYPYQGKRFSILFDWDTFSDTQWSVYKLSNDEEINDLVTELDGAPMDDFFPGALNSRDIDFVPEGIPFELELNNTECYLNLRERFDEETLAKVGVLKIGKKVRVWGFVGNQGDFEVILYDPYHNLWPMYETLKKPCIANSNCDLTSCLYYKRGQY